MWYFNGEIIKTPKAMTISDVTHPAAIFRDSATLTSLGIKPYKEVTPDSRYYTTGAYSVDTSGSEVVGTYAGTAKTVANLKTELLAEVHNAVASRQADIDWYWSRADKGGTAVPSNIATYATTIYTEQDAKETEIAALNTLTKIKEYHARSYTETRKTAKYNDDGSFKEYDGTHTLAREINMCTHFTANPNDEVDPAFVSLVAD